jgi:hypothetical protein
MKVGIKFSDIKVYDSVICDGHHRYLASLLANYPLDIAPSFTTSATKVLAWDSISFDDDDWHTLAKVKFLNEQDAEFNNMGMNELLEILK